MSHERRPLTKSEIVIAEHAAKLGIDIPHEPGPDADGVRRSSCLKYTMGEVASPEDRQEDQKFVKEMREQGYTVTSSSDGMSWELEISDERFQANLRAQYQKGIDNTQPKKFADPALQAGGGYYAVPETQVVEPVTLDSVVAIQAPVGTEEHAKAAAKRGQTEILI